MFLPLNQPLDLDITLESGQTFQWQKQGNWWIGPLNGNMIYLQKLPRGLEFFTNTKPSSRIAAILEDYFRLDDDLNVIQSCLSEDKHLAKAISQYPGLRLLRQDPWECLITFLCSQNSNMKRIKKMLQNIAMTFGSVSVHENEKIHILPSPEVLAEAGEQKLREIGLGYRAKYISESAKLIATQQLNLNWLKTAHYETAKSILLTLPGVGEKVAECVLLFSLEKLNAFPIDRWIQRALKEWYPETHGIPNKDLLQWAQRHFKAHPGYSQQYLFLSRRTNPL
ncbi:hypothetical protein FIM02_01325 [SAR202 cluster bacterium AD-802-E10_MRT_200m]|nr:hypothetical protein [SAR202 cluster bacterium AD-802-E10_MRT_200m]MQF82786.1 hypothetical protein [SAR202 cluster bacterium AD-802-E10_MRT_200m]